MRMARHPRNGFGSLGNPPAGSLSPPTSNVRITTGHPSNARTTRVYARYCSFSSGIVARPTTRNSVRIRPTPSAPLVAAMSASSGKSTFARSVMRTSSVVIDSSCASWRSSSSAIASCRARSRYASMSECDGLIASTPVDPSRMAVSRPTSSCVAVRSPTTAGKPSERARIATCEVRVPASVAIGEIEQDRQHTNLDVLEIADALTQHGVRRTSELLPPLDHHDLERLLRAQVLANQLFDGAHQLRVVEDGALHVEDRRFLRARGSLDAIADLTDACLRAVECVVQAR